MKNTAITAFNETFPGKMPRIFSAPGRTEILGNHTDHQRGCVCAAAVTKEAVAAAAPNGESVIRVSSVGYGMSVIDLDALEPVSGEENTTAALIRGVAAGFKKAGYTVGGFDACVASSVLGGSGMSSSAAFEVLMGTVINYLFNDGKAAPAQVAKIGQYAENVYFGKPCGLMDQMASAVGGCVYIDFADSAEPVVEELNFDPGANGYCLCIVDSGADHADLTDDYASVPTDMKAVAEYFGADVLRDVPEDEFYSDIPGVRRAAGDRAVLRAIHFFDEQKRVAAFRDAARAGDFQACLEIIRRSGVSSFTLLQNVIPTGAVKNQALAAAIAVCTHFAGDKGAVRVHGGGFAGTVQAFIPRDEAEAFRSRVNAALGEGACHILETRTAGGCEIE